MMKKTHPQAGLIHLYKSFRHQVELNEIISAQQNTCLALTLNFLWNGVLPVSSIFNSNLLQRHTYAVLLVLIDCKKWFLKNILSLTRCDGWMVEQSVSNPEVLFYFHTNGTSLLTNKHICANWIFKTVYQLPLINQDTKWKLDRGERPSKNS